LRNVCDSCMSFKVIHLLILAIVSMSGFKAMAKQRAGIVWFKQTDMRIRDHMPLAKAHTECEKVDHLFIFDPRNYKDTKRGNLKANMRRLKFQVECVNDVCNSLKTAGCSMTVLLGEPEVVLSDYAKSKKMPEGTQVYCFDDVGDEETKVLLALKKKLREVGMDTSTCFGGSTLFDLADLPYPVEQLNGFTEFRKSVERPAVFAKMKKPLAVRSTFMPAFSTPAVEATGSSFRVLPSPISDVADLWSIMRNWYGPVAETSSTAAGGPGKDFSTTIDARAVMDFHGGETAAWSRIDHYIVQGATNGRLSTYKQTRNGMVGADYSSKLSPYLATGAISARSIYTEIKKFEASSGISNENTYWLVFELLWRDFMRFYGHKYGTKLFHLGGVQGEAGRKRYPWGNDPKLLDAWRTGNTGFPFIDGKMSYFI
jgi:deoxyribodipyrimidine photo-lyase